MLVMVLLSLSRRTGLSGKRSQNPPRPVGSQSLETGLSALMSRAARHRTIDMLKPMLTLTIRAPSLRYRLHSTHPFMTARYLRLGPAQLDQGKLAHRTDGRRAFGSLLRRRRLNVILVVIFHLAVLNLFYLRHRCQRV